MEWFGQVVTLSRDRYMLLLHRLQKRRLSPRRGAIDLVGHQQLCEHWSGNESEAALSTRTLFQHFSAENVGRHQIGSELYAARVKTEHDTHGLDELGLGEAGHANQQRVATGEHRDECLLDHHILTEDHRANGSLCCADVGGRGFRCPNDHVFEFFKAFAASHCLSSFQFRLKPHPALCNKRTTRWFAAPFKPNLHQSMVKLTLSSTAGSAESRRCEQAGGGSIIEGKQWRRKGRADWKRLRQGCPAKTRGCRP